MSDPIIQKPTINFLSEWLSSTAQILFDPRSFSLAAEGMASNPNQASLNLAFAASSIAVAFVIFQLDSDRWSAAESPALALLLIGMWCLYAVISAFLLKLMKGAQDYLTNILVGVRLFAIFYVVEMITGTLAFLVSGRQPIAFYTMFIGVGTVLYAIYFPVIFCKLNKLGRVPIILFIICSVPLAAGRSLIAEDIVIANSGLHPVIMLPMK
jgi:hypothetical protein